ncbi:Gfo/Idh/MocA family protein [Formosa algae]|uniref:Dehydrogenase n=1 Tax=Formosa algae TaxID=225843 RepID=A0A9X1CCY6_9FLAO|nr:Gfo/Idh/MocA family oxidoreductase [Formosa algae]MBP1841607.1 putative dehydrogenase [Formosa algae]MDQ0337000.1 putative dehydrogenase [Formosa algae]OEI80232.1 oxidoreductase [Formosa algae]
MNKIVWGIIGCGDVAEVKSGPAFSLVKNSELKSVMRRNLAKAEDFAKRHHVKHWFNDASDILNDPDINAVYIATPPASHLQYALEAIKAGKHVYLEKPMTLNTAEADQIVRALKASKTKLTVAHYRRHLPAFLKVKALLDQKAIGEVLFADIQILQSRQSQIITKTEEPWRLDPEISGGGLFHDLAPHQLDLMCQYFGMHTSAIGFSGNRSGDGADNIVNGIINFNNGIQCRGIWSFNNSESDQKDACTIYGSEGKITFSFFGEHVTCSTKETSETFSFKNPKHVQEPMIAAVVDYFLGQRENPCAAEEALQVTKIMDAFTSH